MEMKILWTQTALNDLENVFEYYKIKASQKTAETVIKEIVKATLHIQNSPKIGKREELLLKRKFEYRFFDF